VTKRHESNLPDAGPRGFSALHALRIAVPVVLVAVLLYRVDWAQAGREISKIAFWPLFALFVAMVLELIVSTVKWSYALRMHDLRYPFAFLLRALFSGFFFNSFLPTAVGGDVYRVYKTLPPDGFRFRALSAVLVERAVGLLTLLMLGGVGALVLADQFQVARFYCLVLLGVTVAGAVGIVALERGWLRTLTDGWDKFPALNAVHHSIGLLSNRGRDWLSLLAGSVVFQAMSIGILFCLFALLSSDATLAQCALIAAMVGAAAVLPISINGIGVMEGALVAGALSLGIDYDKAVMVAFLRRLLGLSLAASCGAMHLATLGHPGNQKGFLHVVAAVSQRVFSSWRMQPQRAQRNALSLHAPAELTASVADVPLADAAGGDSNWLHAGLLEYTHDAIIIWETDGGGIKYFNRAAEQLYGYSRDEARGRTTHELLKTELAGGVDVLEMKLARFGIWVGELRHTTRDGRYIEVEGRLALMSQNSGRWLVLEVNRDVSDRNAAEAARQEMARQLTELRSRSQPYEIT
jgi:PAS domain S-box-containing protein